MVSDVMIPNFISKSIGRGAVIKKLREVRDA